MLLREMREMPRKQTSVVVVFPLSVASNCWPVSGSTLPPRVAGGTAWYVLSLEASGVLAEERGVQRGGEHVVNATLNKWRRDANQPLKEDSAILCWTRKLEFQHHFGPLLTRWPE